MNFKIKLSELKSIYTQIYPIFDRRMYKKYHDITFEYGSKNNLSVSATDGVTKLILSKFVFDISKTLKFKINYQILSKIISYFKGQNTIEISSGEKHLRFKSGENFVDVVLNQEDIEEENYENNCKDNGSLKRICPLLNKFLFWMR